MSWRITITAGFLAMVIFTLAALQTPILHKVRGAAWEWWVAAVGTFFQAGTLRVTPDVADQLVALQADNVRLYAELEDWRRIREQIASPGRDGLREIPAAMAGVPFNLFRSEYVINRGAQDGVTVGAPVVAYGSVLVGFVSELSEHTALVRLLYHPAVSIPVSVQAGDVSGEGLAHGVAHTSVEVTTIPQDVPAAAGHTVVTVGDAPLLPPGLVVGRIAHIQHETHEPYQRARLTLPFDPSTLRAVLVLELP